MSAIVGVNWEPIARGLGNHVWQSTLFAVMAALLTLMLRKNQAQARYSLWLAASVKFLIPFAPLVALGQRISWLHPNPDTGSGFSSVIEQAGRPFSAAVKGTIAPAAPTSSMLLHWLPLLLAGVWFCGSAVLLVQWAVQWRKVSKVIGTAASLREGREVEALGRIGRVTGIEQRVPVLLSHATLEPGIFGWSRPVLLWPQGISDHLEDRHLDAIMAHELWHVRRRDNLAAALHMLVEAVFWFHPFVWWVGSRLIDERERACDEKVLELGGERHVYAESVLKVCEFCIGSPLACVAGVTGSDLKKRMVHIMTENVVRKLEFSKKLLLSVAASLAIAIPIGFGLMQATPSSAQSQAETAGAVPAFQSFSIKPSGAASPAGTNIEIGNTHGFRMMYGPDGFVADSVTLKALIQEAYGVEPNQISGPEDLLSGSYDVAAKADPASGVKFGPGSGNNAGQLALQAALAEHLKLAVHRETKVLPVYALEVAEGGAKLQATQPSQLAAPQTKIGMQMLLKGSGQESTVAAQGVSINDLVKQLSMQLGLAVIDKTGLKGPYNFSLHWAQSNPDAAADDNSSAAAKASLLGAVQEQLGLKLEPQKQPMDIIVIDHIEKPEEN